MRSGRLHFATFFASASCAAALLVACGGAHSAAPGAASPTAGASPPDDGGVSSSPMGTPLATGPTPSNAPTTTIATLADGGDVQGTRLQSSQTSVASADAASAGPARGAHVSEPGRAMKDIQVIIQSHRDAARACYDEAQAAHPDPSVKGNLDVKWTIDPAGKVSAISVDDAKSDIHDPGIGKCVMDVVRGVTFAVSAKGYETYAHYPFNFNPHNGAGKANAPTH